MQAKALKWLLESTDPSVRLHALKDVLGLKESDPRVRSSMRAVLRSGPVASLRRAQNSNGCWPPDETTYSPKFISTVWQLMLLGELGAPRAPWIESAVERFLGQHQMANGAYCCGVLGSKERLEEEPCLTGNMVRTLLVFGYGDDDRVRRAIEWLPEHQFDDGGWNCDYPSHNPSHSSFMSTVEPLWAYSEIPRAKWTRKMKRSAEAGAEFLLSHRVYKSHHTWEAVEVDIGRLAKPGNLLTRFHFPMYYFYDALHGMRVLCKLGYQDDERMDDAFHLMLSKMTPGGMWLLDGDWVREVEEPKRKTLVTLEEVGKPSKWVTLNCYRVLSMRGDLELPAKASV